MSTLEDGGVAEGLGKKKTEKLKVKEQQFYVTKSGWIEADHYQAV